MCQCCAYLGHIYKRKNNWWIAYGSGPKRVRESTNSPDKAVALALLAQRETERAIKRHYPRTPASTLAAVLKLLGARG